MILVSLAMGDYGKVAESSGETNTQMVRFS